MKKSAHLLAGLVSSLLVVGACGGPRELAVSEGVQADHEEGRVSVVGTDSNGNTIVGSTATLAENDCILLGDDCITPEAAGRFCEGEGGPIDVIVVDGKVVEVVCYPAANDAGDEDTLEIGGDGDVIDGNNVAVYGNGADNTVLRGNVVLDGNNVRLRGLTIDGDLTLAKNNLAAVFVVVTGNVIITGNNNVLAGSVVFGDLTVGGNNTILVQNGIGGAFAAAGTVETCTDNRAFDDANNDGVVVTAELGDPIDCN